MNLRHVRDFDFAIQFWRFGYLTDSGLEIAKENFSKYTFTEKRQSGYPRNRLWFRYGKFCIGIWLK